MLEQIVLEQFVEGHPKGTSEWVRYHRPPDLAAAVALAEDHLAPQGSAATGPAFGSRSPDSGSPPESRPLPLVYTTHSPGPPLNPAPILPVHAPSEV